MSRPVLAPETHPFAAGVGLCAQIMSAVIMTSLDPGLGSLFFMGTFVPSVVLYLWGEDVRERPAFILVPLCVLILALLFSAGVKGEGILITGLGGILVSVGVRQGLYKS